MLFSSFLIAYKDGDTDVALPVDDVKGQSEGGCENVREVVREEVHYTVVIVVLAK